MKKYTWFYIKGLLNDKLLDFLNWKDDFIERFFK